MGEKHAWTISLTQNKSYLIGQGKWSELRDVKWGKNNSSVPSAPVHWFLKKREISILLLSK